MEGHINDTIASIARGVPNGRPAKPNIDVINAKYQPIFFGIIRKKIERTFLKRPAQSSRSIFAYSNP